MIVWGGSNQSTFMDTGDSYCALPPPCLFCDDFEDGVLATDWTYVKGNWTETGGDIVGTPSGKSATAVARPAFSGCSLCTFETTMQSDGGLSNKLWFLPWYQDKKSTVEVLMKEGNDKWILRQRINGRIVNKVKAFRIIQPNVSYDVHVDFDGAYLAWTERR